MKKITAILTIFLFTQHVFSQNDQEIYEQSFEKINCMLDETCKASFKEAVFIVENAYFSNQLDRSYFNEQIHTLSILAKRLTRSQKLIYDLPDKEEVAKYASLFSVITDTIPIQVGNEQIIEIPPYTYDFDDIWGHLDWSNMFVTKLLETKKGNCHSLPYLYKILADEIGAKAHIAVAPNHFYIKHQNKANGWYNTELTSGIFPIDAWLMASGYIHLDAIVNKIYMEALDEKQMLALCLIDLAKGYERKFKEGTSLDFVMKCSNTALEYYPHFVNALILKAETTKKQFDILLAKENAKHPTEIFHLPEAKELFTEMTYLYNHIHELGYRKMPEDMYLDWLVSLKEERYKYENKNISNFNPQNH